MAPHPVNLFRSTNKEKPKPQSVVKFTNLPLLLGSIRLLLNRTCRAVPPRVLRGFLPCVHSAGRPMSHVSTITTFLLPLLHVHPLEFVLFAYETPMSRIWRTMRFGFGENEVVGAFEWFNEIDESKEWQKGIYNALCGAYACVSLAAFIQLIRIQMRVPEYGWTTQKVFHFMNFLVNGLRAVLFGLYKSVFQIRPKALEEVLMDLPGLLFFSTYTLLVLFWAEIYHQARSAPAHKLRPAYFIINGIVYLTLVCIWIFMRLSKTGVGVEVARVFFAVISFCAALGFFIYGGRLFFLLRRFPIESRGRQKKLYEVGSVTSICCICFLIRCIMLAVFAFDKEADLDVLDHPQLNLIYYLLVEILPSAMVLFILRKLPPRRVSDQYHPIS